MLVGYTNLIVLAYILIVVFFLYTPPRAMAGLGEFVSTHWGDSIGFYVLHLGVGLVVLGSAYPTLSAVKETGTSLILAGTVALKLQGRPPSSGNGNGSPVGPVSPAH